MRPSFEKLETRELLFLFGVVAMGAVVTTVLGYEPKSWGSLAVFAVVFALGTPVYWLVEKRFEEE